MDYDEEEVGIILRKLGVNGSYKGFHYAKYGISLNMKDPENIIYICKGLYVDIASRYSVNIGNVERNIRTVVNVIWNSGNRELLNDVFGREVYKKPGNAAFIDAVSHYIVTKMKK